MIDDFIGVFDGVNTPKECQKAIQHFELLKSRNLVHSRQQLSDGPTFEKHDETAFLLEDDVYLIFDSTNLSTLEISIIRINSL